MTRAEYSNNSKPLEIAILGAGLVGAVAGIALSKLSNVNVTIYERSEKAREVGAWIGLTESSLQVLRELVDIDEIQRILYRGDQDGGYVKRHWKTDEILAVNLSSTTTDKRLKQARTHRVPLHNFLLSYVPEGIIKYGHSAKNVNVTKDRVDVSFDEKDPIHADLLVAADGIYSRTRRQFTGDTVQYKGAVAYRNVFPMELLKDIPNIPNDTSAWVKDGDIMFFSPLGLN
ncbi:hypothetical protein LJB42_002441 [Komagataella kurtzmanii]|nr:hypothetical protein LJB42_002441 [Komagataella kurtzmanii]